MSTGPTAARPGGSGSPGQATLPDAVRMAFGTFTAWPVSAPRVIDRRVGSAAMLLAPVAGLSLALLAGVVVLVGSTAGLPALATAVLAVGAVALGNRGLHVDGLSDTADGLSASYDRTRALEVMHRGDAGPTGVTTLIVVLLGQCAALSGAVTSGHGVAAVMLAVVASRGVVPMCCARGVPAAQPTGLGATVAGAVHRAPAFGVGALLLAGSVLLPGTPWWQGPVAVSLGFLAAALVLTHCVRRLGGINGDVLGACVECATLGVLLGLSA